MDKTAKYLETLTSSKINLSKTKEDGLKISKDHFVKCAFLSIVSKTSRPVGAMEVLRDEITD